MISTVSEIENAIAKLPLEEKETIRNWLEDVIEQHLELREDFKAKINRAQQEIAAGIHSRVRSPENSK